MVLKSNGLKTRIAESASRGVARKPNRLENIDKTFRVSLNSKTE